MLLSVKSKEHYGKQILINADKIQYIFPNNEETVVYFSKADFIVLSENFDEFKLKFLNINSNNDSDENGIFDSHDSSAKNLNGKYKDSDQYPDNLPRLPSGYVDKRTTIYKEWVNSKLS